jgi:hypothetical protein
LRVQKLDFVRGRIRFAQRKKGFFREKTMNLHTDNMHCRNF